jgi:hypothetical protein
MTTKPYPPNTVYQTYINNERSKLIIGIKSTVCLCFLIEGSYRMLFKKDRNMLQVAQNVYDFTLIRVSVVPTEKKNLVYFTENTYHKAQLDINTEDFFRDYSPPHIPLIIPLICWIQLHDASLHVTLKSSWVQDPNLQSHIILRSPSVTSTWTKGQNVKDCVH